jgi:hypothetical protein
MPALTVWQKSSYSGGGEGADCVEVAALAGGVVRMRESDQPGAVVTTSTEGLGVLLLGIKVGRYDHLAA